MQHYFEIYLLHDTLTSQQWDALYRAISQYSGLLTEFRVIFRCTDNVVRFFINSQKDLSSLSNNLEGMVLRPVSKDEVDLPEQAGTERFVKFVTGGSLLDLKEKYSVKKSKHLEFAEVKIRSINANKAVGRLRLYFKNAGGH